MLGARLSSSDTCTDAVARGFPCRAMPHVAGVCHQHLDVESIDAVSVPCPPNQSRTTRFVSLHPHLQCNTWPMSFTPRPSIYHLIRSMSRWFRGLKQMWGGQEHLGPASWVVLRYSHKPDNPVSSTSKMFCAASRREPLVPDGNRVVGWGLWSRWKVRLLHSPLQDDQVDEESYRAVRQQWLMRMLIKFIHNDVWWHLFSNVMEKWHEEY